MPRLLRTTLCTLGLIALVCLLPFLFIAASN